MQFPEGYEHYLVESTEELADRLVELLTDRARRQQFGDAARAHVQRDFLLPRLLRDELRVIKAVLEKTSG